MTIREFIDKYYPTYHMCDAHQATWDLFEELEETLGNDSLTLKTKKGSCSYKINTALEVCNPNLPDYNYLKQMQEDISKL